VCARFSELDEALAIEFRYSETAQSMFEKGETRRLRSANTSPDFQQVFAMQLDQISNRFCIARPLCHGGLAAIDTALNLKRP